MRKPFKIPLVVTLLSLNSRIAGATRIFDYLSKFFTANAFSWNKFRVTAFPTTFIHLVSNIVRISPQKQMARIYTNRVIALVKYMQSKIKPLIGKLIGNPMRSGILSIKPKLPIKHGFSTACFSKPRPTLIGSFSVNLIPKTANVFVIHAFNIT